jgi:hypothetical protein
MLCFLVYRFIQVGGSGFNSKLYFLYPKRGALQIRCYDLYDIWLSNYFDGLLCIDFVIIFLY